MKYIVLFLLITSHLLSAPAFSKMREFKNADGTTFLAKAKGNHHLNWIQTKDGEILKYNKETKNYEYAKIKGTTLKASGVRYEKSNSKRARSLGHINKVFVSDIYRLAFLKHQELKEKKLSYKRYY